MFRCRHCEYLQTQLERARSDARQDLATDRAAHEKELNRLKELLDEALRRNDVLQLAVLQGAGSAAGSNYASRIDRANEPEGGELVGAPEDLLPETEAEVLEAPFAKLRRAALLADKTEPLVRITQQAHWIHEKKEQANKAAVANPPGSFVRDPRPENDLVGKL